MKFVISHPYLASMVAAWIFNNVVTALVSNLPAPTKDSSARYVYWFKVANTITGNLQRARSTAIEGSPNWQAAVEAYLQRQAPGPSVGEILSGIQPQAPKG